MKLKWNLFIPAAFFAGWLLVSNGVPLMPVVAGVAAAAALNLWRVRAARANRS